MDIEGAEPRAFQGMRQILEQHQPVLLLEFSPELIELTSHVSPESFLNTLAVADYDLYILERNGPKRQRPYSTHELMNAAQQSQLTHLDLVAYHRYNREAAQL